MAVAGATIIGRVTLVTTSTRRTRTLTLPDRATWLEARRLGIGGSEAAAVLGVSPYATALQVYADKIGAVDPVPESEEMYWGRILEPLIADRYESETNRTLAPAEPYTIHVHPEHDYLRATLDRIIIATDAREGVSLPAPLEIKTANAFRADDWLEEPPLHVQVQGQHQLLVTGHAWVSFAVLIGGQVFRWADKPRSEKFLLLMAERLREFWRRVELLDPPAPGAADREILEALYPHATPEASVALPAEAATWDRDREIAISEIQKWQAVRDTVENKIRAAIGDATFGVLPGGGRYSWARVERAAHTVVATSYRQLRRLT